MAIATVGDRIVRTPRTLQGALPSMPRNGLLAYFVVAMLVVALIALGIVVFQFDNLEQRFLTQSQQLRALGDSTDRLAGRVDQLVRQLESGQLAPSAGSERTGRARPSKYAHVELLHPEVENYLQPSDFDYPPSDAAMDGTLARGWSSGDPRTLNPILSNAAEVSTLLEPYLRPTFADRMVWTDPSRWQGDLAWRAEITDDYKEYTFYLKEGVLWHAPSGVDLDGAHAWLAGEHEVTAHDFVFFLDMMLNPQVENGFAKSYYADIDSWEAVSDYVFVVRWKRRVYLSLAVSLALEPLPEFLFAYEEDGSRIPDETLGLVFNQHWYNSTGMVGSGPYRMTRFESGAQIRLVRNENYSGDLGARPAIKELVYPIYTDPKKTLLLLKAHEIAIGTLRPGEYREEILRWQDVPESERPKDSPFFNGDITCEVKSRSAYNYIGWNSAKPIFADKRVRRALGMALNRDGIIENVFVGLGFPAVGPFLPGSPYSDPTIKPLDFDLEGARALLGEVGWEDTDGDGLLDRDLNGDGVRTPFEFRFMLYGSSPEWASLANIYKDDLLKIGVKIDVEPLEWSLMTKRMDEKEFDAFSGGWLMGWESDPYQLWHSSQADIPRGSNRVGFRNAEADELIERLRETFDEQERVRMFRRLHGLIFDSQAYTFFKVAETPYCWWKDVENVVFARTTPIVNTLPWWVASPQ